MAFDEDFCYLELYLWHNKLQENNFLLTFHTALFLSVARSIYWMPSVSR